MSLERIRTRVFGVFIFSKTQKNTLSSRFDPQISNSLCFVCFSQLPATVKFPSKLTDPHSHSHSHLQFTVHSSKSTTTSDGLALPGHSTGGVAVLPQRRCLVRREPHRRRFRSPRHHSGTTFSHYFALFFFFFCSCWKKLDALAMKHSKNHNWTLFHFWVCF